MITQVSHTLPGTDPAGYALALEVAAELHTPAPRAPEVAAPASRTTTAHRQRRSARARRRAVQD